MGRVFSASDPKAVSLAEDLKVLYCSAEEWAVKGDKLSIGGEWARACTHYIVSLPWATT